MVNAYLIGANFQTKDVIILTDGYATIDIYQAQTFEVSFLRDIAEAGDYITIFDNGTPKFTGIIEKTNKANGFVASGSNIKQVLAGIQYFVINALNPVYRDRINVDVVEFIKSQLMKCFPSVQIDVFPELSSSYSFSSEIRISSLFEILHNATSTNNLNYQIYLMGRNIMHVHINENRHLESKIKLITDITHEVVDEIKNAREFYNQIIGLGAGEEDERDFHFIDDSNGNIPKCYVYDLRENISHEELVRRTEEKYETLTKDYSATFRIVANSLYEFGEDYTVGDYVGFANQDGLIFDDLISTLRINIKDGILSQDYEVSIGRYRGTLTDKINELKEGGVR